MTGARSGARPGGAPGARPPVMLERLRPPLAPGDAAALLALEQATQTRPLGLAALVAEALAPVDVAVALVARRPGGDPVGFATARLLGPDAHVVRLAVDPAARRQGSGAMLLAGLIGWAQEVGAAALTLEVRVGNRAALALYARAGLEVIGRRRGYYPDGEDALVATLVLGEPAAPAGSTPRPGTGVR